MKRLIILFEILLALYSPLAAQWNIIPTPTETKSLKGEFVFNKHTVISYSDESLKREAAILRSYIQPAMGFSLLDSKVNSKSSIILVYANKQDNFDKEEYQLKVSRSSIEIISNDSIGFFYAFQTLLQLLPSEIYKSNQRSDIQWMVKAVYVKDKPKFNWRGIMLDVSRQFYPVEYLKKYINWLAAYKINVFHLHLTDDEGWRIEIKTYPKLTKIGAWRGSTELLPPCHGSGDGRYGGFYTQDELKDLVQYAKQRNIQILPEIDIPGHSKSVAVAYPEILCDGKDTTSSAQGVKNNVWCASEERNYDMLDKIIAEVAAVFPFEYIHIGGDEVNHKCWETCSRCNNLMRSFGYASSNQLQNYMTSRVEKLIEKHGKKMIGWNEILDNKTLNNESAIMVWTSNEAIQKSVQANHPIILSPASYFYIDMAQGEGERGHNWATFLPLKRLMSFKIPTDSLSKKNVIGLQANLWSEYLNEPKYQTEYQSFPRICGLAELSWSGNETEYKEFEKKIESAHYERMYNMGIHFRVHPPEVKIKNNKFFIENSSESLTVLYTTDGSKPSKSSLKYDKELKIDKSDRDVSNYRFCFCYRDSLISPVSRIKYDDFSSWGSETLPLASSNILRLKAYNKSDIITNNISLLFRYLYGETALEFKKISIYRENKLIFEKILEKPVRLFTQNSEWYLPMTNNVINKKGEYTIEIILNKKIADSNGTINIVNN